MKHGAITYKTKRSLGQALKKILRNKDIAHISISEVTEKAGVNRKTFYYHFTDIYDLMRWTFEDDTTTVVKNMQFSTDYRQVIKKTLDYLEENAAPIRGVMDSQLRNDVRHYLYVGLYDAFDQTIDEIAKQKKIFIEEEYREYISMFSAEAVAGILFHWIAEPEKEERAKVEKYLVRIFRVTIENLLTEETKH